MNEWQALTGICVTLILAITFLVTVKMSQRHYFRIEKADNELELARVQERIINGRAAEDLDREAKAAEQIAKARERELKAVQRLHARKALEGPDHGGP